MKVLSIGDRVPNGTFRLHSRFERAVNFTEAAPVVSPETIAMISLVAPDVGAGPVNLVVDTAEVPAPRTLVIACGAASTRAVVADGRALDATRAALYDSRVGTGRWDARAAAANLDVLCEVLIASAPKKSLAFLLDRRRLSDFRPGFERSVAAHIEHCVRDAVHGDVLRATRRLRGCGFGLTPSGDDFLCGMLIAMNLGDGTAGVSVESRRRGICEAARSGNVLTDTFLALARDGRVSERIRGLVDALLAGSRRDVAARARQAIAVGETSGADFATGLLMELRACARRRAPVPAYALAHCRSGDATFRC
jgi:hypothetical protein